MVRTFKRIRKELGEYFLGTETKNFFKEKGKSYTAELIIGKYIPNIWDAGIIATSVYFKEPKALELLIFPEALRLVSMMKIPEDKEKVEEAEFYKWLSREASPKIQQTIWDLREATKAIRRARKNIEGYLNNLYNI